MSEPRLESPSPFPGRSERPAITELPAAVLVLRERMLALALNSKILAAQPDGPWSWPTPLANGKSQRAPSLLQRAFSRLAVRL